MKLELDLETRGRFGCPVADVAGNMTLLHGAAYTLIWQAVALVDGAPDARTMLQQAAELLETVEKGGIPGPWIVGRSIEGQKTHDRYVAPYAGDTALLAALDFIADGAVVAAREQVEAALTVTPGVAMRIIAVHHREVQRGRCQCGTTTAEWAEHAADVYAALTGAAR